MRKKSLSDEAVDSVAWQALVMGSNLILKAAILIFLARNIPAAEFGLIAAAMVVTSIATDFSQLGVHRALVQRLDLLDDHVKSAFAISLLTGIAAAAAIFLAAPAFVAVFRMDEVGQFIRFLSATLLFTGIAAVSAAMLQRERRFRALGFIDLGSYLLGFGCVALPMAIAGFGAWALAAGQMVQVVSRTCALFLVRAPRISLWPSRRAGRELLHTGYGFSAGQIGNFVATQIDYAIVGRWLGAEALGFYNRAYQFLLLPAQLFGTVTSTVLFPTIASIQDQPQRVARAYVQALGVIAMLTLPVSGVLAILAPELVLFLLGPQWTGMIVPFQILVLTLIFRTSYKISDAVTLAMGSMYQRARRQWIYAGAVAAGALAGMQFGLAGVAVGVGMAVILNYTLMMNLARSVTGLPLRPVIAVQVKQLGAASAVVLPIWLGVGAARSMGLASFEVLAVAFVVGAAFFGLLWFRFRAIFGEEGAWVHELAAERLSATYSKLSRPSSR